MAITSYDSLTAAIAGAQVINFQRTGGANLAEAAGNISDYLFMSGVPGAATVPTVGLAGEAVTKDTPGVLPFTNPAGGATKYLSAISGQSNQSSLLIMYDRLWQNSGIVVTDVAAQSFGTTAVIAPRDANGAASGVGVRGYLEVYTATGNAAAVTASVSYTNSLGVPGRTGSVTIPATAVAGTMCQVSMQAGDAGIRSIESITLGTSLISGVVGMVLARPIASCQLIANAASTFGWDLVGGKLFPNSALSYMVVNSGTTLPTVWVDARLIEG